MKNERGSITLFTLIAMIFLLTIAFTAYASAMAKLQAQNEDLDRIVANYGQDINAESLAKLYADLTSPKQGKASEYMCIDGVWCNSPDLIGFNQSCTYYVTYDNTGKETISEKSVAETEAPPANWYNYREKRWANVVTINNGNKTYWVWIPRFKYKIVSTGNTDVKFVGDDGSGNEVSYIIENGEQKQVNLNGYNSSNAFEFNGKQLKGYWVSKYRVQEGENTDQSSTIANIEVDVSGFNPSVTKFVTYDNSGAEQIGANIQIASDGTAQNKPSNWYDYKNKKWANIVTENNGLKAYWTYIPRFEYKITGWNYLEPEVKFLKSPNLAETQSGFKMSNAFEFFGKQLRGYWVSKYRVQE